MTNKALSQTMMYWPFENIDPDPSIWTECDANPSLLHESNEPLKMKWDKYLQAFSPTNNTYTTDVLLTTLYKDPKLWDECVYSSCGWQHYLLHIKYLGYPLILDHKATPLQKIQIDYNTEMHNSMEMIQPNNDNPNLVLSSFNNSSNVNFQNMHIYNNRGPLFIEGNATMLGNANNYEIHNINITDTNNNIMTVPAGIVKHKFTGYGNQKYGIYNSNSNTSNPIYRFMYSPAEAKYHLGNSLVPQDGYANSTTDPWGTPFNYSEQFVKQERVFDNTKLTTYYLPRLLTTRYNEGRMRHYVKYKAKETTENHPDHVIVRYFCRNK